MLRRHLVVLCLAAMACGEDPPAEPPRAVKRRVDTDRIPVPNHSPQVMSDPGKPRRVSVAGKMEADIGGRRQHFTFFSKGKNAAAHFERKGVSWVRIQGALNDDGSPFLSFALEPLNLATLEFPATFSSSDATPESPKLKARYELSPGALWVHPGPDETPITLTLTALEGNTLSGTFSGTLVRQDERQGGERELKIGHGTFEIELRRSGDPAPQPQPQPQP